jgi:hypothetical protein
MLTSEPINGKRISDLMQTVSDAETLESVGTDGWTDQRGRDGHAGTLH